MWAAEFYVGIALSILAAIILVIGGLITLSSSDRDRGTTLFATIGFTLLVGLIGALCFFPFEKEYLSFQHVSGEITSADSRLMGKDGGGMEEAFVFAIDGGEPAYRCKDIRCASGEEGDVITLNCKKVWEFRTTHGYDCRFIGLEKNGGN